MVEKWWKGRDWGGDQYSEKASESYVPEYRIPNRSTFLEEMGCKFRNDPVALGQTPQKEEFGFGDFPTHGPGKYGDT